MTTYRLDCPLGEIRLMLYEDRAPATCRNFSDYVRSGFMCEAAFYRVLGPRNQANQRYPLEVVQGGLSYRPDIGYEPSKGLGPIVHETTASSGLRHTDGTVSMGRFLPGETYGGFCICIGDQPELDFGGRRFADGQGAAAFGRVVEGQNIVRRIGQAAEDLEFLATPIPITAIERVGEGNVGGIA